MARQVFCVAFGILTFGLAILGASTLYDETVHEWNPDWEGHNSSYVVKYSLSEGEHFKYIQIYHTILTKKDPSYIKTEYVSIPYDGHTFPKKYTIVDFATPNISLQPKEWKMSSNYAYQRTTMSYNKAQRYVFDKWNVNLSEYMILSDLVVIAEGDALNTIYCYRVKENGIFYTSMCSDSYNHIINLVTLPILITLMFGLVVLVVLCIFAVISS